MPHYRRCWGCPADKGYGACVWPCDVKQEWQRKVAGLGLTSVLFPCAKFTDHYQPGMCVKLQLRGEFGLVDFDAAIMGWSKVPGKLHVWLSAEHRTEHQCIKVYAKNVTLTGETVELCNNCGVPVTATNMTPEWYCMQCLDNGRIKDGKLMREIAEAKA